ncbi:MAG: glutathione S-transferase family protein [Gammaproteobacteria bacterium]
MLELYHHGVSACAAKVRLALAEKRLPWTSHYVDIFAGEQFAPAFIALNPAAVVPVLIHNRAVVTESTAICEYLEDIFAEHPIYPSSPSARANARQWTKAVDEELHPACAAITYAVAFRHTILRQGARQYEEFMKLGPAEGSAARALKWQWIQLGLDAPGTADKFRLCDSYLHKMDDALKSNVWLAGPEFSMADIAVAPYVNRLAALSMQGLWMQGRLINVESWIERVRLRPTFKPALVDWVPSDLTAEMSTHGGRSWPAVAAMLGL